MVFSSLEFLFLFLTLTLLIYYIKRTIDSRLLGDDLKQFQQRDSK